MFINHLKTSGNERLLLIFLGWSGAPESTGTFDAEGYDITLVYDYRDPTPPPELAERIGRYRSCTLIGWSFGVWCAERYAAQTGFHPEKCIALNGTSLPADERYGIPPRLLALTLRSIRQQGIDTFNRRMCGAHYLSYTPAARPFDELCDELEILSHSFEGADDSAGTLWDYAVVGDRDLIFPPENQFRFWEKKRTFVVSCKELPHYPFTPEGNRLLAELLEEKYERPR